MKEAPLQRDLGFLVFPAGPADAEDLARVHVAAWRETYRDLLPDAFLARMSEPAHARRFARLLRDSPPHALTLVAAGRGGIVGYVEGGPSRSGVAGEAELATLYLLRAAQGRGLGRRLLAGAARAMAANGATSLAISVLRDNTAARAFYEHLGGMADPPRPERGPGGATVQEVTYRWAAIGSVFP